MHQDVLVFLVSLAMLLGSARLLGEGARRVGLPAVAGEILSGVLLGRTVLGRLAPRAFAWTFPEGASKILLSGYTTVAVMLLLVVAGLEIDLRVVRRSGRVVVATSVIGLVVPFLFGWGVGLALLPDGDLVDPTQRGLHATFLGIAFAISALPVIARTLLDLGLMKTDIGLIILSAAVFNNVIGWIGFSVLSRRRAVLPGAAEGSPSHIALALALTTALVIVGLLILRPITDRLLARLQPSDGAASGSVLSLILILALLGGAATQALGLHAVFGAFVIGIAVGDSRRLREHARQTLRELVTSVFTPVFFASAALRVDFAAAFDLRLVVTLFAVASVAKIGGAAIGARMAGVAWRESAALGFGLNSRGAMEIVLAMPALEAGIINAKIFVALVIMAVVTSSLSGPALVRLLRPRPSPIAALLSDGAVVLDSPARDREELIVALAAATMARLGRVVDAGRVAQLVLERELLAGTGVGDGVAFPHAEVDGLARPALAFARLEASLDFDAPDGAPARLVFLLLTPPRHYDSELQILAGLARLLTREQVRSGLLQAPDAAAVLATIERADQPPPGVVVPIPVRARA